MTDEEIIAALAAPEPEPFRQVWPSLEDRARMTEGIPRTGPPSDDRFRVRETDGHETTEGQVIDDGSLTGAAKPLCSYCSGEHVAADCPTRTASAAPPDDAEGTR